MGDPCPSVTLLCCSGGTHPIRCPLPATASLYEWTLLMCGWLIRQKQYRENVLPSYLDQIMKAQTRSILRAREAQQDCRGGLILTKTPSMQQLRHLFLTCCSTCVIPSSWISVLTSRLLLHQSSILISSSRPHVALLELAPCLLSHATQCSLSTSAPSQPPPLPCSNDSAPPLLLSSPLLPTNNLIHLPHACPQNSFTAVTLPVLMTSTSPMLLASFAPSDY